jgi:cell wall-associated NlpC family hydrolase
MIRMFAAPSAMSKATASGQALPYASCNVSIAPLRREPSHRSEQTSQLLFGERAEILRVNGDTDWVQVRCAWDGYEGWCKAGQIQSISPRDFRKDARLLSITGTGILQLDSAPLQVPLGSELTGLKKGLVPVGEKSGKFKGKKLDLRKLGRSPEALLTAASGYMHAPYQWGGRSISGIDCSGLVQMAFKLCGVPVPRDAARQADMGEEVHFLAESVPGDVAFFDNQEGRIVHVGILLDRQTIIHATDTAGRVVQDRIDSAGIISVWLRRRTHTLRAIRRVAL